MTLSEELLRQIDEQIGSSGSRSGFLEEAVRLRLRDIRRAERGARDIAIYERLANEKALNREIEDNLDLQEDLWNEENCTESLEPLVTHEITESS